MNIFAVDQCPTKAAVSLYDVHTRKMPTETAQMLSTAHHVLGNPSEAIYKPTHVNHPCSVWIRKSSANYLWAYDHFVALCKEFTHRTGRIHKSSRLIDVLNKLPPKIPYQSQTPFAMVVADRCLEQDTPIEAYREYYRVEKIGLLKYTNRLMPDWLNRT